MSRSAHVHPLEDLVENHSAVLVVVDIVSVVCGLQIALNMLWHLRVANANSGRGVLRIIRNKIYLITRKSINYFHTKLSF